MSALVDVESFAAPTLAALSARRLQTRLGPLADERAFELGQSAKDVENQPPASFRLYSPTPWVTQCFGAGDEMGSLSERLGRSSPPDHQRIVCAQMRERASQDRTDGGAADGILEDLPAPGRLKRITVDLQRLVVSRPASGMVIRIECEHRRMIAGSSQIIRARSQGA